MIVDFIDTQAFTLLNLFTLKCLPTQLVLSVFGMKPAVHMSHLSFPDVEHDVHCCVLAQAANIQNIIQIQFYLNMHIMQYKCSHNTKFGISWEDIQTVCGDFVSQ